MDLILLLESKIIVLSSGLNPGPYFHGLCLFMESETHGLGLVPLLASGLDYNTALS